jgi:CheY-like chemotaxis protein
MARVLYVEDNEDNVYMLKRWLTRKGYEVSIAIDGKAGVDMAKAEHPDLILMDLNLPVMDGWEATSILKKDEATKDIPIIALSAHAMMEHKQRALECGADDYDTKPVDVERLLSKMSGFLDK